jgi:hypothetical protein
MDITKMRFSEEFVRQLLTHVAPRIARDLLKHEPDLPGHRMTDEEIMPPSEVDRIMNLGKPRKVAKVKAKPQSKVGSRITPGELTGYGDPVKAGDRAVVTLHKDGQDVVEYGGQPVQVMAFVAPKGCMAIRLPDGSTDTITFDPMRSSEPGVWVRTFKVAS